MTRIAFEAGANRVRLLVELPAGTASISGRRCRSTPRTFQKYRFIETQVHRIELPERHDAQKPFVWAHAVVLPKDAVGISTQSDGWIRPGVFRAKAYVKDNARTLASLLASGVRISLQGKRE